MKRPSLSRTRFCIRDAARRMLKTTARGRFSQRILCAISSHSKQGSDKPPTKDPEHHSFETETNDVVIPQQLWDELFERALEAIDYSHLELFD